MVFFTSLGFTHFKNLTSVMFTESILKKNVETYCIVSVVLCSQLYLAFQMCLAIYIKLVFGQEGLLTLQLLTS